MDVDVVVGGGGLVGLPLAIALARGGLSVAIADPAPKTEVLAAAYDGRVSALAYASVRMARALGVWTHLEADAQPIDEILVTDAALDQAPSPFSLHFDHGEIGTVPLGVIAENRHIRQALYRVAEATAGLTIIAPAAVKALASDAQRIKAYLSDGQEISARLAVAADGRESPLRESMGISVVQWSYPQQGIVTTVHHEHPHRGVAYEHFLPSGPFAILPMTGNRSSLVWTERNEVARRMMALDHAGFDAEIARRFGAHLGSTRAEALRWSYPLRFHLARAYVRPRFALAGDAAHGIHPIAGQGLNLGLKDAAALADVILEAAALGLDIGALHVLARYERWRRFDSFTMAASTDALNRLFSNDIAPLRLARGLGLAIVDQIGPLRRFFMRQAGGDLGDLPTLMREDAAG
ncbi:MAG: FAD-dependent monooxygenase [Alphaproteobacteria bacterium]|nr:FAD-dependent monooxygenase [Alphaproteobacteria bacterium]